jgi:hypothetical protein
MSLIARAISWIDALLLAAAGCWLLLLRRMVESSKNF